MIHGLKYEPAHPHHCPHVRLFDEQNERSWTRRLLRHGDHRTSGLCIGFGWSARGSLRRMHARANETARALADFIHYIRCQTPHRPIHIIAHSLGAEVALCVLQHLSPGDVHRMILLTGASHRQDAKRLLGSPAGRNVEVLNVTTRQNDLFDLAFEQLVPGDGAIGRGIDAPNVLNLQLDCAESLAGLDSMGFTIAHPRYRVTHWSAYTRPGTMAFYAAMLHDTDRLSFPRLRSVLPHTCAPHYTRLWPQEIAHVSLPLVRQMKNRIMGVWNTQGSRNEHAH